MAEVAWQVAQVLESGRNRIRVRFGQPEFCQRCASGEGCGAGVFAGLFPRRNTEIEVETPMAPSVGDWVRIGVPGRVLALTAWLAYGLPILAFVVGALPAHWWMEHFFWRDVLSLTGGLLLGGLGWFAGRHLLRRNLNPLVESLSCASVATKS